MNIDADVVRLALSPLSDHERARAFASDSQPDARTAFTKFATKLVALAVIKAHPDLQNGLTARASFKGSKSGRAPGGTGGIEELGKYAAQVFRGTEPGAGIAFEETECLVDFLISKHDVLSVVMTAESEATPLTDSNGTRDVDKLLLVSSPWRLFVGRVNVTKTGKDHKVGAAESSLRERLKVAVIHGHVRPTDSFSVVLLRTSTDSSRKFYLTNWTALVNQSSLVCCNA